MDLSGVATPRNTATPECSTGHHEAVTRVQRRGAHKRKRSASNTVTNDGPSATSDSVGHVIPPDGDNGNGTTKPNQDAPGESSESAAGLQRRAISGLRPVQATIDIEPVNSQRQIHSGDKFPKRRKQQPEKHVLRPSSLDKLIQGIWEQIHGSLDLQPKVLLELAQPRALEWTSEKAQDSLDASTAGGTDVLGADEGGSQSLDRSSVFKQNNIFCSRVTQASRTCRALEVIVQARWVEQFDAYVDGLVAAAVDAAAHSHSHHAHSGPTTTTNKTTTTTAATTTTTATTTRAPPRARLNKGALGDACADFGWSEKELRNKMAIWRGYSEIRTAGGWAALAFAGHGVYRFCKYRVGFGLDSTARLRRLAPAFELAADTLQPGWRALLAAVGGPAERVYAGHPHDWVVSLDGSREGVGPGPAAAVVPLRLTYLQWDPAFTFRHIDECVVDERAWPGGDPRWTGRLSPSSSPQIGSPTSPGAAGAMLLSSSPMLCEACGREQSDDARRNACACFPTVFGAASAPSASPPPPPVLVFRTTDGRNNGLLALCPFERGAAVGEFVGLVTRGLADVDVMEGGGAGGAENDGSTPTYQIWQGREGNFTRFVNHSCRANAQYQRFTWLGTQRVVLVSKGIEAGEEITVDYSDKYWRGLDKKCLCGQSCCRYRRDGAEAAKR